MTPDKQVSPAIRILRGERDASARATHLEAATRKFLVTTNERKYMSTKTNFKRIALVAVAALGLGVLSSVPSQAVAVGVPVVTVENGTATVGNSDSTGAATVAVKLYTTGAAGDSILVTATAGTAPTGAASFTSTSVMMTGLDTSLSTGSVPVLRRDSVTAWLTTGGLGKDSASVGVETVGYGAAVGLVDPAGTGNAYGKFGFFLDTTLARTAGTYTIDYLVRVYSGGAEVVSSATTGTISIVVSQDNASAAGAVAAAGTSSATMYTGTAYGATTTGVDSSVSVVSTPDGTVRAVIRVVLKTSAGLPARESITVTTTIGNLGFGSAVGKSLLLVGNADGINDINLTSDGSGGTAVITVKSTSVTFANKAATFYGDKIATITGTVIATTIGTTEVNTILAVAKDAAGVNVRTAASVYAYSDALSVINTGTAPAGTSCGSYSSTLGGFLCKLTGSNNGTANITLRDASTSTLSTVASTPLAVKVNTAPAASVSISFNKATYAPGEVAYIIVKPLDSAKAAIGAASLTNVFSTTAPAGITSSVAFGNGSAATTDLDDTDFSIASTTAASDGYASTEAIKLYKVYMPASGGTVTISATGGSLLPSAGKVLVTATATVTDSGAAALAAVTALATTVASLKTLITTLTNLVLKIQKKVKA